MKLTLFSLVTASTVAALLCTSAAQADGRRDFYAQQAQRRFFDQPQNARTFGMEGSSVATSSDSSSVVGNPAGLGMMEDADFSATYGVNKISGNEHPTYRDIEADDDYVQALAAIPLGPVVDSLPRWGNIGLGWSTSWSEWDDDSLDTEEDTYRITGAYSKAINEAWSVGYSLGYFDDEVDGDIYEYSMDDGFRHTIGVQGNLPANTKVGASAFWGYGEHDLEIFSTGQDGSADVEEFGFELGAGWQFGPTLVTTSMDYLNYDTDAAIATGPALVPFGGNEHGDGFNVRVGVEHQINDWLVGRAGYRYGGMMVYYWERPELEPLNGSAKLNAWSLGAGVVWPINSDYVSALKLDYGVEYRAIGDDDWQHVVTVSVPTDLCRNDA